MVGVLNWPASPVGANAGTSHVKVQGGVERRTGQTDEYPEPLCDRPGIQLLLGGARCNGK